MILRARWLRVGACLTVVLVTALAPGPDRAWARGPSSSGVPAGHGASRVPVSPVPLRRSGSSIDEASVTSAYQFLDLMMDRYATGSTPRLVQSFTGGLLGQENFTDSETYDDALVIDA